MLDAESEEGKRMFNDVALAGEKDGRYFININSNPSIKTVRTVATATVKLFLFR